MGQARQIAVLALIPANSYGSVSVEVASTAKATLFVDSSANVPFQRLPQTVGSSVPYFKTAKTFVMLSLASPKSIIHFGL